MAGNVINTLYPPVCPTFMPAFVNTEDAVVNFSLSPFNSPSEILRIHITCVDQLNNENALNTSSGIIMQTLGEPVDGVYSAKIPISRLIPNGDTQAFKPNQFYKVQIRLDCYGIFADQVDPVPKDTDSAEFLAYLLNEQASFSEWSTVCLIRPILQPEIFLNAFDNNQTGRDLTFHKGIISITGSLWFGDNKENTVETLQSYKIQVLPRDIDEVLYETSRIYTGDSLNPNNINYKLDLQNAPLGNDTAFRFKIIATTKNQYTIEKEYPFKIGDYVDIEGFNPIVEVDMDNESGIATVTIDNPHTSENLFGTLYVKRSSSISNFMVWESINETKVVGRLDHMVIKDNTVGAFIWYRYSVQFENSKGALTDVIRTPKFLPEFYGAFISRKDQQLSLRYDFKITNFKHVVNRTKIDTLGGKYPKFTENAILNYKQFGISGLISQEDDFRQLFLKKKQYYGDNYANYQVYLEQSDVKEIVRNDTDALGEGLDTYHVTTTLDDWFWEREFREEAVKWLNDGEPKLFRTMTEGIIPVMITDVNLTPKVDQGRRIWNFSATAYEIADGNSLETLASLGIIDIPKVSTDYDSGIIPGEGDAGEINPYIEVVKAGQIYQETATWNKIDVVNNVVGARLIEKYAGVLSTKVPKDFYLKDVKIYFHSQPQIFLQTTGGTLAGPIDPTGSYTDADRSRMMLGYVFELSKKQESTTEIKPNVQIFVNSKGYYQLPNNIDVEELYFPNNDVVTLEYLVAYKESLASTSVISGSSIERSIVGQESGIFGPGEVLGERIRHKYSFVKGIEYYEKMQFWKGICIDVTPYAVVNVRYRGEPENSFNTYVVGRTGVLHLQESYIVEEMYFSGRRLSKADSSRKAYLDSWEFVREDGEFAAVSEIEKPQQNCVYNIGGVDKIYYQDEWYNFTDEGSVGIAAVPVEGMVNYTGDLIRVTY